jgi:hypothetical protein
MKAYGGADVEIYIFLTSALAGGGQLHALAPLPRGKSPGTRWGGGRVDPRAGLDDVEKGTFLILVKLKSRTPRSSSP